MPIFLASLPGGVIWILVLTSFPASHLQGDLDSTDKRGAQICAFKKTSQMGFVLHMSLGIMGLSYS